MCIASSVSPQPFVLKAPISVPVIIDISGSPDRDRLALLSLAPVIAEREAVAIVESDFSKATAQFFESAKRSPDVTVETMLRLLKTPSIGWVYIGWAFQAHATTASLGYTSKHHEKARTSGPSGELTKTKDRL
ncbi:hypothetical protein EBR96_05080 [bacterium]|nr:hypothetical protein [bacterium]